MEIRLKDANSTIQLDYDSIVIKRRGSMSEISPYLPLITILGPIIGALIGAAITYFVVVKHKRVIFYVSATEDLTQGLRQHLTTGLHPVRLTPT